MNKKIYSLQSSGILLSVFIFAAVFIFISCSGDDSTGNQTQQVAEISISPENASIEVGEQFEFSVVALTATGDTVNAADFDLEWNWWSDDPDVFTVQDNGLATGVSPGEAFCFVEADITVSENVLDSEDEIYITSKISNGNHEFQTVSLELTNDNSGIHTFKNVSFKKKMRFTGRDSAFVFVF